MGFATSPFTLDPVRSNEFKEAQISKEIYSLNNNIERIRFEIGEIKKIKEEKEKVLVEEIQKKKLKSFELTTTTTTTSGGGGPTDGGENSAGVPDGNQRRCARVSDCYFYRKSCG